MNRELASKNFFPAYLLVAMLGLAALMGGVSVAAAAEIQEGLSAPNDFKLLEGRWTRPDGGYVLELKSVKKDGSVSAAYYNPRSINVFRAQAGKKGRTTTLYVELRDINYPGSKYNLVYDAKTDRLKGAYFQAVENRTFQVEFVRTR